MTRLFKPIAVMLILIIGLVPSLAEARAGGSRSSGSMGSRTYSNNGGQALQRSTTPQSPNFSSPGANAPRFAPAPAPAFGGGLGGAAGGGSFFQRHPILTGIGAGFIGAGIGSMIFGNRSSVANPAAGTGAVAGAPAAQSPFGMFIGFMLQMLLIGLAIYLVYRLIKWLMQRNAQQRGMVPATGPSFGGNNSAYAGPWGSGNGQGGFAQGGQGGYGQGGYDNQGGFGGGYAPQPVSRDIRVGEADEQAFGELLVAIQRAWSEGNLNRMRMMMTPEMLGYFTDEIASNTSRGIINKVEDVRLISGQVQQAWEEDGRQYATARISFAARDYNVRLTPDGREELVSGKPDRETVAEEMWTFVRANGGNWLLSAIQQV
ncbi:MAG: TIM44-like domain-containing protein [Alphaproteobacteria bacterium]|nr:TIM44-like domain-containing protein [Alphaproteobacteria bacterium]